MATGSDNDFAELIEEITLEKFEMWTVESLRTYLPLRNKSTRGGLWETSLQVSFILSLCKFYFGQLGIDERRYCLCQEDMIIDLYQNLYISILSNIALVAI